MEDELCYDIIFSTTTSIHEIFPRHEFTNQIPMTPFELYCTYIAHGQFDEIIDAGVHSMQSLGDAIKILKILSMTKQWNRYIITRFIVDFCVSINEIEILMKIFNYIPKKSELQECISVCSCDHKYLFKNRIEGEKWFMELE